MAAATGSSYSRDTNRGTASSCAPGEDNEPASKQSARKAAVVPQKECMHTLQFTGEKNESACLEERKLGVCPCTYIPGYILGVLTRVFVPGDLPLNI